MKLFSWNVDNLELGHMNADFQFCVVGGVCNSPSPLCFALHNSNPRTHFAWSCRWNYIVS